MYLYVDNPKLADAGVDCAIVAITILGCWFGRKRLLLTFLCLLVFLVVVMLARVNGLPVEFISYAAPCRFNLYQIGEAKRDWARYFHKGPGDIPTEQDLCGVNGSPPFLTHPLKCSRGGKYTIGAVSNNPTCSYANKGHRLEP